MAPNNEIWNRNTSLQPLDPNEKLFLFGYSCKIFQDDEKAGYLDEGKHLIPWMGDETVMIDRYDARGCLHDLKQYEPIPGSSPEEPLSEEEILCNEERYRSLRSDMSEEQLYQGQLYGMWNASKVGIFLPVKFSNFFHCQLPFNKSVLFFSVEFKGPVGFGLYYQEEELKRLRAALANDGAYHEIGFSYDNEVEKYNEPVGPKVEELVEELYEPPPGLEIPKEMEVPYNMKIHAIIEKTALFVSEQGGQMEIIIKIKQHGNPKFAFMYFDNPLYPYYKFLIKEIKSGSYKPIQEKQVSQSEDEDEDDEGHYLHPTLLSGKKENVPEFTVPAINFCRSQDDSYSVLVRNLQQQLADDKAAKDKELAEENSRKEESNSASKNHSIINYRFDNASKSENNSLISSMVIPKPDIQPIIQKMVEYVAKNGEDFENVVKSKNDKRFDFLKPSCEYYNYYIHLRDKAKQQLMKPNVTSENIPMVTTEQVTPSEVESPNRTSETAVIQTETSILPETSTEREIINQPLVDEYDALYSQDSQVMFGPEPQFPKIFTEEQASTLDSVNSLGIPKETKSKSKVLKGPINFSMKTKESNTVLMEKLKMPLFLDNSDEDSSEETSKEKGETVKTKEHSENNKYSPNSRQDSVVREEKLKLTSEMEAKLAEECMKDKLLSAARERLVQKKKEKRLQMEQQMREEQLKKERQQQIEQQRKEKQLQLERKKKAELFVKMLKKRDGDVSDSLAARLTSNKISKSGKSKQDFCNRDNTTGIVSPKNGILFSQLKHHTSTNNLPVAVPSINNGISSSSASEESGEEIMITEFSSEPDPAPENSPVPMETPEPAKYEHKKKKRSRSKSREHRSKSSKRYRHRSRSPKNHKHKKSRKERELPAAHAVINRSRSRSRSPSRYRLHSYRGSRR